MLKKSPAFTLCARVSYQTALEPSEQIMLTVNEMTLIFLSVI